MDIPDHEWRLLKIGFSADMKGWNLMTRGDGKTRKNAALPGPVRMVSVGLRARDAATGSLELARVALVPSPLAMIFATSVVNNLFVPGDKTIAQILLDKGVGVHGSRIWIEDAYGNLVKELPPETLSGGSVTVTLPGDFGYYSINAMIPDTAPDGALATVWSRTIKSPARSRTPPLAQTSPSAAPQMKPAPWQSGSASTGCAPAIMP